MGRGYAQLTLEERRKIERWRHARVSVNEMARVLRRHRSTIFRELRRNHFQDPCMPKVVGYFAMAAQLRTSDRRARQRKLIRHPQWCDQVVERIKDGWTPEQIAGRMHIERAPLRFCHQTVYRHLYAIAMSAVRFRQRDIARPAHRPVHRAAEVRRQANASGDGQGHCRDPCLASAGAPIDHFRPWYRVPLIAASASRDRREQLVLRPLCTLAERHGREHQRACPPLAAQRPRHRPTLGPRHPRDLRSAECHAAQMPQMEHPPKCSGPRCWRRGRERPTIIPPRSRGSSIAHYRWSIAPSPSLRACGSSTGSRRRPWGCWCPARRWPRPPPP